MSLSNVCPICASPQQEVLSKASVLSTTLGNVVRCASCSFIYRRASDISFAPHDYSMDYAHSHPTLGDTPDPLIWRRMSLVESAVARGAILDIGCGSGRFLECAQQKGWKVAGIETDEEAHLAETRLFPEKIHRTLEEGVWPSGMFDAVTIWEALEHWQYPADVLRLAAHYCRIDGVLMVTILNGEGANNLRRLAMTGLGEPEPEYLFTPTAVRRLLARYGFRIERLEQGACHETHVVPHPTAVTVPAPGHKRTHFALPAIVHIRHRSKPVIHDEAITVVARYVP